MPLFCNVYLRRNAAHAVTRAHTIPDVIIDFADGIQFEATTAATTVSALLRRVTAAALRHSVRVPERLSGLWVVRNLQTSGSPSTDQRMTCRPNRRGNAWNHAGEGEAELDAHEQSPSSRLYARTPRCSQERAIAPVRGVCCSVQPTSHAEDAPASCVGDISALPQKQGHGLSTCTLPSPLPQ